MIEVPEDALRSEPQLIGDTGAEHGIGWQNSRKPRVPQMCATTPAQRST